MTKNFYFNTAEALDKAKADRDKPVTPVEYKPVISDAGADSNMLWPDTMYGLLPKGTGKITLLESKPAQQEPVATLLQQSKENFERNFGSNGYADWIYKDLADLLDTPPAAQPAPVLIGNTVFPSKAQLAEFFSKPPAQRQWVGLTDEDIEQEFGFIDELLRDCVHRTEAKLKEKNT